MSGSGAWQSAGRNLFGRAGRGAGLALRVLVHAVLIAWFAFAAAILLLRYAVLPNIDSFRGDIQQAATAALGLPVRVERVESGWDGLRPEIRLHGVRLLDRQGKVALSFRTVDAVLGWTSVAFFEPRFHRLHAEGPVLSAERTADGQIFVAGFPVGRRSAGDPALADWLLAQESVGIEGATLEWTDAMRGSPPLRFERVSILLDNDGPTHRIGMLARPDAALAGPLDFRAEFSGESLAHLDAWSGQVYLSAADVDLSAWKTWFDLPVDIARGQGGLRFWGRVAGGRMTEASADLALRDVRARLGEDLPTLALSAFAGRLTLARDRDGTRLTGLDVALTQESGAMLRPTGFHVRWGPRQGGGTQGLGYVTSADVGELARLAPHLPLGGETQGVLAAFAPDGRVDNLQFSWSHAAGRLATYTARADFTDLALAPSGRIPGFAGLSGHIEADEKGGRLSIASGPVGLEFPAVFPEPSIALDELSAELAWTATRRDGRLDELAFELRQARFSGPDASGEAQGRYRIGGLGGPGMPGTPDGVAGGAHGAGEIDLSGTLTDADATAVRRYLPHAIPAEVTGWLKDSLTAGRVDSARFVLAGPLDRFPFAGGRDGRFLVEARLSGARLRYHADWPAVDKLDADLRFEGERIDIRARQARSADMALGRVEARIEDIVAAKPQLRVLGQADGRFEEFTRFLDESPLGETLGRFYDEIRIAGGGRLKLELGIPLDRPEATKVRGEFELAGAEVNIDPMLPPVTGVSGKVAFTERDARSSDLAGRFLGESLAVSLRADDREVRVAASGAASVEELRRHYGSGGALTLGAAAPLFNSLSGVMPWKAAVSVKQGRVRIGVESSLEGLASTLPAPLAKPAERPLPVSFTRLPLASERRGRVLRDQFSVRVGDVAQATLVRRTEKGNTTIERGVFGIAEGSDARQAERLGGEKALPTEGGLKVSVRRNAIDLDAWRLALEKRTPAEGESASATAAPADIDWPIPTFDVEAKTLSLIGRQWQDVRFTARPRKGGLDGRVEARDTAGGFSWESAGKGTLKARLTRLVLPEDKAEARPADAKPAGNGSMPESLPAIDVVADEFVLGRRSLGRVEFVAENEARVWKVAKFELKNPDGKAAATGRWITGEAPRSEVEFDLDADDVGRFLGRFGYPDAVRQGKGGLDGNLSWQGSPLALHLPSLSGALNVKAEKGQFNKLEPGFGKLLALLSLQSLPRRVTLDFRDVFSEGFAFDRIEGRTRIADGVIATRDFVIEGAPAKVLMEGEVDLARDIQNVKVTIQPEIGGAVALGAAVVVNPVVGVAALLAQKAMKDPLNKAFAFEYRITGPLADPKVEKIGGPPPAPATEKRK